MLKGDIVNGAYSQLRISGLTVDPSPEDVVTALYRLESMAAEWEDSRNICIGYLFDDEPDPAQDAGVRNSAKYALETNLAIRLVPDFNKDVPQVLYAQASQSISTLSGSVINVRQTQYPRTMPRGSGNTRYQQWNRFHQPAQRAPLDCSTQQLPINSLYQYDIDFTDALADGESIASYTLEVQKPSGSATVVSQTLASPVITLTIRGDQTGYVTVLISITTSTGRPDSRQLDINVTDPIVTG